MDDHYLADDTYHRLVESLAALAPEIIGDRLALDPEVIKLALADAGIWPALVRNDGMSEAA